MKAIDSLAGPIREAIVRHRRQAESLVKMHLDDEKWYQVAPQVVPKPLLLYM